MFTIAAWLESIGLQRYTALFDEQAIGPDVLPHLTSEDLRDLAIPLGDRKRLLRGIAELHPFLDERRGRAPSSKRSTAIPQTTGADLRLPAERRNLTIAFCDLVGSSAMATRLDPEDVAEVMSQYQAVCTKVVERWGGYLAEFLGDGAVIYFGWPEAHEDDAERAIRTSLELTQSVAELTAEDGSPLAARVGVATGLVLVGMIPGGDAGKREGVVGETPNLAARLQNFAAPGGVVVAPHTLSLVGDRFAVESLGEHRLKGFDPMELWHVRGVRRSTRFKARAGETLSPFVGREREMERLLESWARCQDETKWHSAVLVGEAGVGKSRMVEEVVRRVESAGAATFRLHCSPYHAGTALFPVIEWLRTASGVSRDEGHAADRLVAFLEARGVPLDHAFPLLAVLLGVDGSDRHPPLNLSLNLQRERTIDLLAELVRGPPSQDRPSLLVAEDVHWADPSTLDLLSRVAVSHQAQRAGSKTGFLLLTSRAALDLDTLAVEIERIELSRLGRDATHELVERLLGDQGLSPSLLESVLAAADGVPLFIEELTRDLRATAEECARTGKPDEDGERLAVPKTLHDLLLSRLDGLDEAKGIAQAASTIGRTFSRKLLDVVLPHQRDKLPKLLERLCRAGVLMAAADDSYTFRHALFREAAYASQVMKRRRWVHRLTAQGLETIEPETVRLQPELLAHHYAEAGESVAAVSYLLRAGESALRACATQEAIGHLRRGLAVIAKVPSAKERDRTELRLQALLGTTYMQAKGWGASEVEVAYTAAAKLSGAAETTAEEIWVLWGLWVFYQVRGRIDEALEASDRIDALARTSDDADASLIADMTGLQIALYAGAAKKSRERGDAFGGRFDATRHRALVEQYSIDLEVVWRVHDAIGSWLLGDAARAVRQVDEAERLAQHLAHPYSIAWCHTWGAVVRLWMGDELGAVKRVSMGRAVALEHDYAYVSSMGTMMLAWAERADDPEAAARKMAQGIAAFRATGAEIAVPFFETLHAQLLVDLGRIPEALAKLEVVEAQIVRWGERWQHPEVYRVRSLARAARDDPAALVEEGFRDALAVADGQGALSWQLRAATDLAAYKAKRDRTPDARAALQTVMERLPASAAGCDVDRAKALLASLSP